MKKYFFLFSFLSFIGIANCNAQSVYQMQFNQLINGTPVPAYGLFFQQEEAGGFLRMRFTHPTTKEVTLLSMSLTEDYIVDTSGNMDTTKMYVLATNPEVFLGSATGQKDLAFMFTLNNNTGEMEPAAMCTIDEKGEKTIDNNANLHAQYVAANNITKELFSAYFQEGDEFLESYFAPNTKDITPAEKNMTIHMLIVADTLEQSIGQSCAMDVHRAVDTYTQIAEYIGSKIKVRYVAGKNYNKRNVVSELKMLKPSSKDVVIFYYTGHGYNTDDANRRYPNLDLRANKKTEDYRKETLNMEDIYKMIRAKGARMNLVLSDCCNSKVGLPNVVAPKPFKKKSIGVELNSKNVRALFLDKKISILATAADTLQRAASNNTFGGFFSYYLKTCMEKRCSKTQTTLPSWNQILKETETLTVDKAKHTYCAKPYIPANICDQRPISKVE